MVIALVMPSPMFAFMSIPFAPMLLILVVRRRSGLGSFRRWLRFGGSVLRQELPGSEQQAASGDQKAQMWGFHGFEVVF